MADDAEPSATKATPDCIKDLNMQLFSILSGLAVVTIAISAPQDTAAARSSEAMTNGGAHRPRRDATKGVPVPVARPSGSALFNAAYHRSGRNWDPVLFLCDGVNGRRVVIVTTPNARGLSQVSIYRKPGFAMRSEEARVGDEDPGAGQIMRELRRSDGAALGSIHSVNPGVLGDAHDTTLPTLSSISVGSEVTPCRWMAGGRLLFVGDKRTVVITAEAGGGYTYRSFDHAKPGAPMGGTFSVATATVRDGRLVRSSPGVESYEFSAGPWTYRLKASADNRQPGATLTVLRSNRVATISMAVAYEMAAARRE